MSHKRQKQAVAELNPQRLKTLEFSRLKYKISGYALLKEIHKITKETKKIRKIDLSKQNGSFKCEQQSMKKISDSRDTLSSRLGVIEERSIIWVGDIFI